MSPPVSGAPLEQLFSPSLNYSLGDKTGVDSRFSGTTTAGDEGDGKRVDEVTLQATGGDEDDEDDGDDDLDGVIMSPAEMSQEEENEELVFEDGDEPAAAEVHSVPSPSTDGKSHLKPYLLSMIDQRVFIQKVADKGRCLFTRNAVKPGDIIFVEGPVLAAIASVNPELWQTLTALNDQEAFSLPPVWHLAAITSLTRLDLGGQRIVQQKFVPGTEERLLSPPSPASDPDEPPSKDVLRVLEHTSLALDPQKYQRALNAWRFNGFGHHAESEGLILYDRISNMSHSCNSSATWHYGAGDAFVLRARQHLGPGEEISISYIGDDDLMKPTHVRRQKLASWQFTCQCSRCSDPVDHCRGFRCPDCGTGTIFMKTDCHINADGEEELSTTAQACTVCTLRFDAAQMAQYEQFEEAYISRLEETSKDYPADLEIVYQEAGRVFTQHHVMYELDTMLFETYKEANNWMQAAWHQQKRLEYASAVRRTSWIKQAWMHEDLGDILCRSVGDMSLINGFYRNSIARAYETAFNSLILLCGADHEYTLAAHVSFFVHTRHSLCRRSFHKLSAAQQRISAKARRLRYEISFFLFKRSVRSCWNERIDNQERILPAKFKSMPPPTP